MFYTTIFKRIELDIQFPQMFLVKGVQNKKVQRIQKLFPEERVQKISSIFFEAPAPE